MNVPVYRPEITLYARSPDGEWGTPYGTQTATLFVPMDDEDGAPISSTDTRRVVRFGLEPFFTIVAPEGSQLIRKGRASYLNLPDGKVFDAITATAYAKQRDMGLDLVRPGREPARAVFVDRPPAHAVAVSRAAGPVKQLSFLD